MKLFKINCWKLAKMILSNDFFFFTFINNDSYTLKCDAASFLISIGSKCRRLSSSVLSLLTGIFFEKFHQLNVIIILGYGKEHIEVSLLVSIFFIRSLIFR